jgi:ubiquinone/menaquinone biosynthesis C-methylase UbiE
MAIREWRDKWRRLSGRGAYPHEFAFLLLFPFRSVILSPRELVSRLHLAETSSVLELGPGPGFFSERVERSIPRCHLYLVDLQLEMLNKARRRLSRAGLRNASFTQAAATALPFAPGVFDIVFLVAVLGEVPDPGACVESICHALGPGGILSVTELPGDPDAITEPDLVALVSTKGFEHLESFPVRGRGFTANFRKPTVLA